MSDQQSDRQTCPVMNNTRVRSQPCFSIQDSRLANLSNARKSALWRNEPTPKALHVRKPPIHLPHHPLKSPNDHVNSAVAIVKALPRRISWHSTPADEKCLDGRFLPYLFLASIFILYDSNRYFLKYIIRGLWVCLQKNTRKF